MPTYDYQCEACGHKFEAFQSIKADPIKICPVCNKKKVKRLIGTGGALIFKGSGFYCTDYRDSGGRSSSRSDSSSSSTSSSTSSTSSSSSSETKSESKTTAKSDTKSDTKS